jgi:hypothetical protein
LNVITFKNLISASDFFTDHFSAFATSNRRTRDHGTFSKAGSYE